MIDKYAAIEAAKVMLLRWDDHYRPQSHSEVAEHKAATWITEELARREWQDEPDGDGWYWCEDLPADSTPQLFRSYLPLKFNSEDSTYSVEMNAPRRYRRWTIAGWVEPTGRVCKITERPT